MAEIPVSALEAYAELLDAASRRSDLASILLHLYVNGGIDTDVNTESGPVASIAKQAHLYLQVLPDAAADLSKLVANGRVYESVAEALADPSVIDGRQFWARQVVPKTGQDLYRRSGSVAVYQGVSIAGTAEVDAAVQRLTSTGITQVPMGPRGDRWGLQMGSSVPFRVDGKGNSQLRLGVDEMQRKLPLSPKSAHGQAELGLAMGNILLANPAHIARSINRPLGPRLKEPLLMVVGDDVISRVDPEADASREDAAATAATQVQLANKELRAWDEVSWITRETLAGGKSRVEVHDGLVWRALFPNADGFTDTAPQATGSTVRFLSDRTSGVGGALTPHAKLKTGELIAEAPVLWHRQGTGQSLSLGSRGFVIGADGMPRFVEGVYGEVFSKTPSPFKNRCLAFKGFGARGYYGVGGAVAASAYTDFEPLQERYEGDVLGETNMSGFANGMNRYLNERGTGIRYLCSISGVGGRAYSGLKKGTAAFTTLVNMMTAAKQLAQARGMIYRVAPLSITHGESEPAGTSQATYAGYLREWLDDYQAAAKSLDASMPLPGAYLSQMNRGGADLNFVTLAQLQLHESDPEFTLVGPKYQYRYHDAWHPYAEAYYKVGEYEMRAERFRLRGQKLDCLRPLSVTSTGTTVTVNFSNTPSGDELTPGPVGKLQVNPLAADPGHYGFALTDSAVSIISVVLLGSGNQVQINLSGVPAAGSALNYALANTSASRGCISDTDMRDISAFDGQPLHNWLVAFSKPITFV